MLRLLFLVLLFFLMRSFVADASVLQMSVAGDMVLDLGINNSPTAQDKLTMRGAELMLYAPVDHRFNGVLSATAHDEGGEAIFELHELFLSSSKIVPRGQLKVGQFFLGVGRLNQIHQHDWPFIRAPKVHKIFFDNEGVFDSGTEFSYLLPTDKYWYLTLGLTSGYRYGHAHTEGSKPLIPTHYFRLETFSEFASNDGLKVGLNYLGRKDKQKNNMSLGGIDLIAKWREGKRLIYLLQSESWFRQTKNSKDEDSSQVGLYVFNQFGLTEELLLGFRLDAFKDLSKTNSITKKNINNISYSFVPELTWKSSEFATTRAGFSYGITREEGKTIEKDFRFELQFVFLLGAHPAHSF